MVQYQFRSTSWYKDHLKKFENIINRDRQKVNNLSSLWSKPENYYSKNSLIKHPKVFISYNPQLEMCVKLIGFLKTRISRLNWAFYITWFKNMLKTCVYRIFISNSYDLISKTNIINEYKINFLLKSNFQYKSTIFEIICSINTARNETALFDSLLSFFNEMTIRIKTAMIHSKLITALY